MNSVWWWKGNYISHKKAPPNPVLWMKFKFVLLDDFLFKSQPY